MMMIKMITMMMIIMMMIIMIIIMIIMMTIIITRRHSTTAYLRQWVIKACFLGGEASYAPGWLTRPTRIYE